MVDNSPEAEQVFRDREAGKKEKERLEREEQRRLNDEDK